MISFFKLFEAYAADQDRATPGSLAAADWFPLAVKGSPFQLWYPGDPIPEHGTRVLLGVATWSGYDMRLLDVVEEAMSENHAAAPKVDVFNMADCHKQERFKNYIPGIRQVFHSPLAGRWSEGILIWKGQGYEAREHVARMFNSSSAEVVAFVQAWLKKRAAS